MKVVILAGGLGSRLSEETEAVPKPMVEVGEHPVLWHIMKIYAHYGFKEFVLPLGYKGHLIKRYFLEHARLSANMTIDMSKGTTDTERGDTPDWIVHLRDTGLETGTGGRLKQLENDLRDGTFMLTYGDGVADIDLNDLLRFHRTHARLATLTAVRPPARFGGLVLNGALVSDFVEKPHIGEGWINGGFMVLEPEVLAYLDGPTCSLESDALTRLAQEGQLAAYTHERFWQCMDTLRDVRLLRSIWQSGEAPWKVWP